MSEPRNAIRRLSAIMFCDIVGYTALMQEDEQGAMRGRDRQRRTLETCIPARRGRILQYYGDGALSAFDSAIDAVTAAVSIQRELRQDPAVPVRIGIHTGDVVYDDDGVFGDGVNVASRVQSLGSPGTVLVSEKVWDEIKNQPDLPVVRLGEFELKNVKRPVAVYAVAAEGVSLPASGSLPSRARDTRRSVAVLPFMNMSSDPENEFFSDGITEELINVLTRVNGLQVTARTSSFAFKGRHDDVRSIAEKLGVETILEGSVRKAGDRVRITAQLIDAANGYHLFSQTYDRNLLDIFETQDEIANAIMTSVQGTLAGDTHQAALATSRTNTEAHALYLQGLHEANRWTPEGSRRALVLYQRALELDPSYGPALAAIAHTNVYLGVTGQADPHVAMPAADDAARRALQIDPHNAEAWVGLGYVEYSYRWDFEAAYTAFQKALGIAPGLAMAHGAYGMYLVHLGDTDTAIEQCDAALALDPLSMLAMWSRGIALVHAGRGEQACEQFERILEIDPQFRAAIDGKGMSLVLLDRLEEAAATFDRIVQMTGDPWKGLAPRGFVAARQGRTDDARRMIEMLHERARRQPELALEVDFLIIHAGLGDIDEAIDYLRKAAQRRLGEVVAIPTSALWTPFWSEPRVREVYEELGLAHLGQTRSVAV